MTEPGAPEPVPQAAPQCPWCGASVTEDATNCRDCGAAVAQRESIGGLKIAGLTSVDPALEDFDKRPLHLRGPSPSHGVAPALIIGAAAGGPIGLVAIGGVAAVAAAELMGTKRDGSDPTALADVGKPSEVLLQALERADAEAEAGGSGPVAGGGSDAAADAAAGSDHAADDGGRSIWRDLPAPTDREDEEGSV
jgi:hypothetical protein